VTPGITSETWFASEGLPTRLRRFVPNRRKKRKTSTGKNASKICERTVANLGWRFGASSRKRFKALVRNMICIGEASTIALLAFIRRSTKYAAGGVASRSANGRRSWISFSSPKSFLALEM